MKVHFALAIMFFGIICNTSKTALKADFLHILAVKSKWQYSDLFCNYKILKSSLYLVRNFESDELKKIISDCNHKQLCAGSYIKQMLLPV